MCSMVIGDMNDAKQTSQPSTIAVHASPNCVWRCALSDVARIARTSMQFIWVSVGITLKRFSAQYEHRGQSTKKKEETTPLLRRQRQGPVSDMKPYGLRSRASVQSKPVADGMLTIDCPS